MRKRIAIILSLSLITILFPAPAQADQCLSQFPDSSWSNDYPTNLPVGKEILLISSKSSYKDALGHAVNKNWDYQSDKNLNNGIFHPLLDTFFGNDQNSLNFKVKRDAALNVQFTYSGVACNTRVVNAVWPFQFTNISGLERTDPRFQEILGKLFDEKNKQNLVKNLNFIAVKYVDQGLIDFMRILDESKNLPLDSKVLLSNNELESYWALVALYKKQGVNISGGTNFMGALLQYSQIKDISSDNCITLTGDGWAYGDAKFNTSTKICKLIVLAKSSQGEWIHLGDRYIANPNFTSTPSGSGAKNQERKTITLNCKKGSVIKQIKGVSPKCPSGFIKQ